MQPAHRAILIAALLPAAAISQCSGQPAEVRVFGEYQRHLFQGFAGGTKTFETDHFGGGTAYRQGPFELEASHLRGRSKPDLFDNLKTTTLPGGVTITSGQRNYSVLSYRDISLRPSWQITPLLRLGLSYQYVQTDLDRLQTGGLDGISMREHLFGPDLRFQVPVSLNTHRDSTFQQSLQPHISIGPRILLGHQEESTVAKSTLPGGTVITSRSFSENHSTEWGYEGDVGLEYTFGRHNQTGRSWEFYAGTGFRAVRGFDSGNRQGVYSRFGAGISW